ARKTLFDIETPLLDVALRRSHGSSNVQNSTITQWIATPSAETRRGCILGTPKQNAAGSALFELLPGDGAHAQTAGQGIGHGVRGKVHTLAVESEHARLLGSGPRLVPRNLDVMGDLVAGDRVGAGVAQDAAEQRVGLLRRRRWTRRLLAVAACVDHHHAPLGRVVDEADGVGTIEVGLLAGR